MKINENRPPNDFESDQYTNRDTDRELINQESEDIDHRVLPQPESLDFEF